MDLSSNFEFFRSLDSKTTFRGGFIMIFHVVVWTIWYFCSDNIFIDSSTNVKEVDDKSIILAWS